MKTEKASNNFIKNRREINSKLWHVLQAINKKRVDKYFPDAKDIYKPKNIMATIEKYELMNCVNMKELYKICREYLEENKRDGRYGQIN